MDEAIGQIDGRTLCLACGAESIPFGAAEDLVDQHVAVLPHSSAKVNAAAHVAGNCRCRRGACASRHNLIIKL